MSVIAVSNFGQLFIFNKCNVTERWCVVFSNSVFLIGLGLTIDWVRPNKIICVFPVTSVNLINL